MGNTIYINEGGNISTPLTPGFDKCIGTIPVCQFVPSHGHGPESDQTDVTSGTIGDRVTKS